MRGNKPHDMKDYPQLFSWMTLFKGFVANITASCYSNNMMAMNTSQTQTSLMTASAPLFAYL
jgi:hypothetical protein